MPEGTILQIPKPEEKKKFNWKPVIWGSIVALVAGDLLLDGQLDMYDFFDNDRDGDGLSNSLEESLGLNPDSDDTDEDGRTDSEEMSYQEVQLSPGEFSRQWMVTDADGDGNIDANDADQFVVYGYGGVPLNPQPELNQ